MISWKLITNHPNYFMFCNFLLSERGLFWWIWFQPTSKGWPARMARWYGNVARPLWWKLPKTKSTRRQTTCRELPGSCLRSSQRQSSAQRSHTILTALNRQVLKAIRPYETLWNHWTHDETQCEAMSQTKPISNYQTNIVQHTKS